MHQNSINILPAIGTTTNQGMLRIKILLINTKYPALKRQNHKYHPRVFFRQITRTKGS